MSANRDFWRDQSEWPRDGAEWVFLARATDRVGRQLFGERWTGEECLAEPMRSIAAMDARALNNFIAKHLPQFGRHEFHGSLAPPPIVPLGQRGDDRTPWLPPKFDFSTEEYRCAEQLVSEHNAKAAAEIERFKSAQSRIAEYACASSLATAYRARAGGEFTEIPAAWWNTEQIQQRFDRCAVDPSSPFDAGGQSWIFTSRTGVEAMVAALSQSEKKSGGRPQEYNWADARDFCLSQVAAYGKPARGNKRLPTQADLIELVLKHFADRDIHPGKSTVKAAVSKWLKEIEDPA